MAAPTDHASVTVWVAKKGTSEDDAIEIEASPDDSLSKLLEKAFEKLFTKDVPMADIHILPQGAQGEKPLRKRQKVSTLNLDDTLFIEHRPDGGESEGYNTQKRKAIKEEEIVALDEKLKKITDFKDSMKRLSDNEKDVKPVLTEIKNRLNINEILTNKKDALAHLEKLEREMRALKFQLMEIDFNSIDVKKRCLELLKVKGIHGFNYCIKTPIVSANARTKTYKFSNEQEHVESRKACLSIKKKGSWGAESSACFGYGAIGMASKEYTSKWNSNEEADVSTSKEILSTVAVARTTAVQEIVTFEVENATVDEHGLKLVRAIAKASTVKEKEEAAFRFLDEYPAEINMGPFGIGGYFEYTATTTSSKSISLHSLQKRAASQAEGKMTFAGKAFHIAAAASLGISVKNEGEIGAGVNFSDGLSNEEVTTKIDFECSGPTVTDMESLQKNLTDSKNWSCFPSIANRSYKFRKIYTIVEDMARNFKEFEAEIEEAAKVLRYIIEEGPKKFIGEPNIPKDAKLKNVIAFGKTGSGKSALGCVLLGKYGDDGFEVNDSKESCTKQFSYKISTARKIRFYDTVGLFDTKQFDEEAQVFTGNEKMISDIITIWENIGDEGLHAILITMNFRETCSALEAKMAKFVGTKLFNGDASTCMLLIMTNSPEIYYSSDLKAKEYLDKESQKSGSYFNEFYELVEKRDSRVIFVDNRIPSCFPVTKEFECMQHNVQMAEKVLKKVHQLKTSGVVTPVTELVSKTNELKKEIEKEKKKENPDGEHIKNLNQEINEIQNKVKTEATSRISCLHGNTKVLLANYTEKKVSELKLNDQILDRYLRPQKIIGLNCSYLQERSMYQLSDDGPIFTPDHQFFTALDKSTTVVASLKMLFNENPQLDGEDIKEMQNGETVLRYDTLSQQIQEHKIFLVEHKNFLPETKVYFIEVGGEGSYIANNYVAKHELPHFIKRPFTNLCYAKVLQIYKKLDERKKFSVSLEGSKQIKKHVEKIKTLWEFIVEFNIDMQENDSEYTLSSLAKQAKEELAEILNETDVAWFGMYLNQVCTKFLWEHLESGAVDQNLKLKRISGFVKAAFIYLNR